MKNVNKSPVCFAPLLMCWDSAASPLLVSVSAADAPASLWQDWPTDSLSLLHLSSFHVFLPFLTHIEFMRVYLAMLPPSLVRFGVSAVPLGFITGLKFLFYLQGLKQPHKLEPIRKQMKIKYVSKISSLGLIPGFCLNNPHAHCDILTGKTGVIWKCLVRIQCANPGVLQHCRADKSSSLSTLRAVSVFPWPTFSHKENTAHIYLTFATLKRRCDFFLWGHNLGNVFIRLSPREEPIFKVRHSKLYMSAFVKLKINTLKWVTDLHRSITLAPAMPE